MCRCVLFFATQFIRGLHKFSSGYAILAPGYTFNGWLYFIKLGHVCHMFEKLWLQVTTSDKKGKGDSKSDCNRIFRWVSTDRFRGPDHRLYLQLFDLPPPLTLVIPISKNWITVKVLNTGAKVLNKGAKVLNKGAKVLNYGAKVLNKGAWLFFF